ncbi:Gfo/Idh/MocA family oxidoreductase [Actinopolymorpha sp. B11F2]|uniref:Gfo/Idh/MocA family protein n=1 Tax=Actinopolymorpha sp. B11F2 TaxID=3160862 RepID=UPI0032E3AC9C
MDGASHEGAGTLGIWSYENSRAKGTAPVKVSHVGVVGLGGIGGIHIAGWRRLGVEVHGYDGVAEARDRARDELGVVVHADLDDLYSAVDVVDVCTPTDSHATLALAAVRAGRAVVCEKPLTRTVAEADELVAAAREAGVQLHVAQVVRFFAEYAAAQAAVAAGRIGQPAVLRLSREGGMPGADRWYHDMVRSGGIICDVMIHDIDYARWIAGDVVRVYARTLRPSGPQNGATHAYAILTHASGAITHLTASWARTGVPFRTSFELAGSEGLLEYATDQRAALRTAPPELARSAGMMLDEDPWAAELREFLAAMRGGPAPRVSAEDGRAALAIALAAVESAETGRAIELPVGPDPYQGSAPSSAQSLSEQVEVATS